MMVPAYVRRAIRSWSAWRSKNRLYRAVPVLMELDARIADSTRQHQAIRRYERQKVQAVAARLAQECGRPA